MTDTKSYGCFNSAWGRSKKTLLRLLLIVGVATVLTALPGAPISASGPAAISVLVPAQPVNRGQQFTVSVNIQPNAPIAGGQVSLSFDPTVISVTGVAEGTLLKQNGLTTYFVPGKVDNQKGTVTGICDIVLGPGQSVSGAGSLAVVTFLAGGRDGISPITLSQVVIADNTGNALQSSVTNGQVSVSQGISSTSPAPAPVTIGGGSGGGGGSFGGGTTVAGAPPVAGSALSRFMGTDGVFTQEYTQQSTDGRANLTVAAGTSAVTVDGRPLSSITFAPADARSGKQTAESVVSPVFALGPEGSTFRPSLLLSIDYDSASLPQGAAENQLYIAWWDAQNLKWQKISGSTVDLTGHKVTAALDHFSDYAVLVNLPSPAHIGLGDLKIPPNTFDLGETFQIEVTASNSGDSKGALALNMTVDGALLESRQVELAGHDQQTLAFRVKADAAGSHTVELGSLSGTFNVRAAASSVAPVPPAIPPIADIKKASEPPLAITQSLDSLAASPLVADSLVNMLPQAGPTLASPETETGTRAKTGGLSMFGVNLSIACFLAFGTCSFLLYRRRQVQQSWFIQP